MVNVPGITVINGNMDIQVNYENKMEEIAYIAILFVQMMKCSNY